MSTPAERAAMFWHVVWVRATEGQLLLYRRIVNRSRLRVGAWILGGGWFRAVTRLQLVHDRALAAITPDGHVTLSACEPLAEVLYREPGGDWKLTVERIDPDSPPSPVGEAR